MADVIAIFLSVADGKPLNCIPVLLAGVIAMVADVVAT